MNASPIPSHYVSSGMVVSGTSMASSFSSSAASSTASPTTYKPFWHYATIEIENWIRKLTPGVANTGGMLFAPLLSSNDATTSSSGRVVVGDLLLSNLIRALSSASSSSSSNYQPDSKRIKLDGGNNHNSNTNERGDEFNILDPTFSHSSIDGVTSSTTELGTGAILSRLTLGGLTNGLSGTVGGIVDTLTCISLSDLTGNGKVGGGGGGSSDDDIAKMKEERKKHLDKTIPTCYNMSVRELIQLAKGLHRSISARTEMDILATTPRRIADLLCPEISDMELRTIRSRVYDTVVLGLGTHSSTNAASLEDETLEIPVATASATTKGHEIEQWKRCSACYNSDQSLFVLDGKNGDVICTNCGVVNSESIMHEGSQFRKFEGEEDRNHHGEVPNLLFSNSHNMATTLGGMSFTPGAGMGGYGSAARGGIENILRNAHAYTEMNISQFGKEEKKTRIGYKDRQKKDAFYQMAHAGDALGLHEAVVQRAKELFAGFRDDREMVQQFKGVIAACLAEAFDQLSKDGKQLLKKIAGESSSLDESSNNNNGVTHARASRRNDLHSASLAGKGGLLLDTTVVSHGGVGGATSSLDEKKTSLLVTGQAFETKSAATWDIDDCKCWMIEATKSIAKSWFKARQSSTALLNDESKAIPKGTIDELEGSLIEHTLKICEYLELELKHKSDGKAKSTTAGGLHVNTPRVGDMGNIGIKWQHSYERGSGGKGGVGNSGRTISGVKPGERSSRTAGQILLLLTAKKFSNIINNQVAGAAFHKELKGVIGREDAKQCLDRRDEATKARLKQMNRKPWLQARVQL